MTLRKSSLMAMIGILLLEIYRMANGILTAWSADKLYYYNNVLNFIAWLCISLYFIYFSSYIRDNGVNALRVISYITLSFIVLKLLITFIVFMGVFGFVIEMNTLLNIIRYISHFTGIVILALFLFINIKQKDIVLDSGKALFGYILLAMPIFIFPIYGVFINYVPIVIIFIIPHLFSMPGTLLVALYFWRNYKYGPEYSFDE